MRPLFFLLAVGLLVPGTTRAQATKSASSVPMPAPLISTTRAHVLRLNPGQDLRQELQRYADTQRLRAAALTTCVGSLTTVALRLANQEIVTTRTGHFEIVSLVGTLSANGSHLHLAVADSTGQLLGGHLLDGCRVYTTAEVVLTELPELEFTREPDPVTTWRELRIRARTSPSAAPAKKMPRE